MSSGTNSCLTDVTRAHHIWICDAFVQTSDWRWCYFGGQTDSRKDWDEAKLSEFEVYSARCANLQEGSYVKQSNSGVEYEYMEEVV